MSALIHNRPLGDVLIEQEPVQTGGASDMNILLGKGDLDAMLSEFFIDSKPEFRWCRKSVVRRRYPKANPEYQSAVTEIHEIYARRWII